MAGAGPRECLWKLKAETKGWGVERELSDLSCVQEIGADREGGHNMWSSTEQQISLGIGFEEELEVKV